MISQKKNKEERGLSGPRGVGIEIKFMYHSDKVFALDSFALFQVVHQVIKMMLEAQLINCERQCSPFIFRRIIKILYGWHADGY
jgi:hypothetical protein